MLIQTILGAYLLMSPKPACASATQGHMWPEAANHSPRIAQQHAREGSLEICTRGAFRYRWTSPSVHITQLLRQSKSR